MAVASDGVHFETVSAFNAEAGNVGWFKCMIHKVKDVDGKPMFVMDHGTSGAVRPPQVDFLLGGVANIARSHFRSRP